MHHAAVLLTLVAFATLGCQSADSGTRQLHCTLVHLKSGPRQGLDAEQTRQIFGGHFANMQRLAREGHLLLAGPYGDVRHDRTLRGIFVLDTGDRDRARELAESDPGFRAGVFVMEYHDLVTEAPLRALLARELALEDAATRAGTKRAPGEGGRTYVLLTADDGARAHAALQGHPAVLLLGRLDQDRTFALLDVKQVPDLPAALGPAMDGLGLHVVDGWFGSGEIASLRELGRK